MSDAPRQDDAVVGGVRADRPTGRRVGVYVCHCGGNISDYVDVERVASEALGEETVVVARSPMFACSEAGQQEITEDIERFGLDGLVVASCSPKLHTLSYSERHSPRRYFHLLIPHG